MSTPRRPEPTQEELRSAWLRCRKPSWPRTFEDAMKDALLSRLVRITALHPARMQRKAPHQVQPTLVPRAPERSTQPMPGPAPGFDRKRAAAGDREDD